jgi:hypothetical protein
MKNLILTLLLVLNAACQQLHNPNYDPENLPEDSEGIVKTPKKEIAPINIEFENSLELMPYFIKYLNYAADFGKNINTQNVVVTFGDTDWRGSKVLAFCAFLRNGQNVVFVNRDKFYASSQSRRELIIYHELGHCAQLRPHFGYYFTDPFVPKSLMYQFALKRDVFEGSYEYYINELFNYQGPMLQLPANRANRLEDVVECDLQHTD